MTTLHCSFCGKGQHEVVTLIAGRAVFICDECTDIAADVTKEHRGKKAREDQERQLEKANRASWAGGRKAMRMEALSVVNRKRAFARGLGKRHTIKALDELYSEISKLPEENR